MGYTKPFTQLHPAPPCSTQLHPAPLTSTRLHPASITSTQLHAPPPVSANIPSAASIFPCLPYLLANSSKLLKV